MVVIGRDAVAGLFILEGGAVFRGRMKFVVGLIVTLTLQIACGQVVPGTGTKLDVVGDDFESQPDWQFVPNLPKSSRNIDKQERGPLGFASNNRWLEGPHRGTPDILRLVNTPVGGIVGSQHSLLMQTKFPGIPGRKTGKPQQDDLLVKVKRILGQPVPATWSPNCVVRVHIPEYDEWEDRSGTSFGFRTDCFGRKGGSDKLEQYWPGILINFRSETDRNHRKDSAFLSVRGDHRGNDVKAIEVTPGWWTLGLSVSPNGMCHFYARQGVEDLEESDRLVSYYCYGYRAERMDLFFFNVVTMDNGGQLSTPWVVDDPSFYCTMPMAFKPQDKRGRLR